MTLDLFVFVEGLGAVATYASGRKDVRFRKRLLGRRRYEENILMEGCGLTAPTVGFGLVV